MTWLAPVESRHEIDFEGPVARVRLTQTFVNTHSGIEAGGLAVPIPVGAVPLGGRMTIGARVMEMPVVAYAWDRQVYDLRFDGLGYGQRAEVEIAYIIRPERRAGFYSLDLGVVHPPRLFGLAKATDAGSWRVTLRGRFGGVPVRWVRSRSHRIEVVRGGVGVVDVATGELDTRRAFTLDIALGSPRIEAALFRQDVGGERHFGLWIEPPSDVSGDVVAREVIVLAELARETVDVEPLLARLESSLRPHDRLEVIQYPRRTEPPLAEVLRRAVDPRVSRSVLVVGDDVSSRELTNITASLDRQSVFVLSRGHPADNGNDALARAGEARHFTYHRSRRRPGEVLHEAFADYVSAPVLTHASIEGDGVEIIDTAPRSVPDVFAARPVFIVAKVRGEGALVVRGWSASGPWERHLDLTAAQPATLLPGAFDLP